MAKYKVTNLDAPIEADYWVDIPIRDPNTNKTAQHNFSNGVKVSGYLITVG